MCDDLYVFETALWFTCPLLKKTVIKSPLFMDQTIVIFLFMDLVI